MLVLAQFAESPTNQKFFFCVMPAMLHIIHIALASIQYHLETGSVWNVHTMELMSELHFILNPPRGNHHYHAKLPQEHKQAFDVIGSV
jgi:hypothetical protein